MVMKLSPEGVVVAVVASRLGNVFQFNIGGKIEPHGFSLSFKTSFAKNIPESPECPGPEAPDSAPWKCI
jgi:hypothetical protein